ncbi:hypothetical protein ACMFMG_001336 [Clarireedia jacksonii]
MVLMDAEMRSSAKVCYEGASRLLTDSEKRCTTPTPRSYSYDAQNSKEQSPSSSAESDEEATQGISDPAATHSTSKRAPSSSFSSSNRNFERHRYTTSPSNLDLFNNNWLDDPNCVGSEVAAMGEEIQQEPSDWTTDSKSKPGSRYMPRTMPDGSPQAAQTNDQSTLDAHTIALILGAVEE